MADPDAQGALEGRDAAPIGESAAKMKQWRQKNPDKAKALAAEQRIRDKALRELGRRHPRELLEIINRIKRATIVDAVHKEHKEK